MISEMTMRKRLSMTSAIVADEPDELKDPETSTSDRESHDNAVSQMDCSQSSITLDTLEVQKTPCDEAPEQPASARRRRSWFGNSDGQRGASVERSDDAEKSKKPSSRRRRSLVGPSAPDIGYEDPGTPKRSTPRRRSFFGSKMNKSTSDTADIGDDPSERSESSTVSSRHTSSTRRSPRTLDETIGRKPPRPGKSSDQSLDQSVTSESSLNSSRQSLNSAETPPRSGGRGVDRTKSLGSPPKKQKNLLKRGNGLGASRSFHSVDGKMRGRQGAQSSETYIPPPPGTPKTPRSLRRLSLGSLMGKGGNNDCGTSDTGAQSSEKDIPPPPGTPQTTRSIRRLSLGSLMGKGGNKDSGTSDAEGTPDKPNSTPRRLSLTGAFTFISPSPGKPKSKTVLRRFSAGVVGGVAPPGDSGSPPPPPPPVIYNPYDLVKMSRAKRGLPEFSRNMLMDTLAKQVAHELATSNGNHCTPTSFHGNIGQGESIEKIHRKMMKHKGETARSNLLAAHFSAIGIGISKDAEGLIYMCQLFQ
jgi:hypothetical protein